MSGNGTAGRRIAGVCKGLRRMGVIWVLLESVAEGYTRYWRQRKGARVATRPDAGRSGKGRRGAGATPQAARRTGISRTDQRGECPLARRDKRGYSVAWPTVWRRKASTLYVAVYSGRQRARHLRGMPGRSDAAVMDKRRKRTDESSRHPFALKPPAPIVPFDPSQMPEPARRSKSPVPGVPKAPGAHFDFDSAFQGLKRRCVPRTV